MQYISMKDFILQRGQLSIAARLLMGRLAACRTSSGHSTKELSVISSWSESKVRNVLSELQVTGSICAIEAPSFERGRPRVEYCLNVDSGQIFIEQHELGLSMVEQLLETRVNAPTKDLDCFLLVVLWLEAKVGTLWSEMSIELLQELGVSDKKVQGALGRLAEDGWFTLTNDDVSCDLSQARHYLLSLDKFKSVTREKLFRMPAALVNVLDADDWTKRDDQIEPSVAKQLVDLSSGLFVTLFNEGIMGTDRFQTWADQARSHDVSCDEPYITSSLESFTAITGSPISWPSYLNLFSSLNVSAECIRKGGGERLNLAMAEDSRNNRFSLVTINRRYA